MFGKEGFQWRPTSPELMEEAENNLFSSLHTKYTARSVNIGPISGNEDCKIWTISMNENCTDKTPLVLLHGLGAGVGFWVLNLDALAASGRPIYAIDHLGFARSSRPTLSTDPEEAEQQFVTAVEIWRDRLKLKKFVLLGHSFGGFVATSYALSFPKRVAHLLLIDPWGLTGRPKSEDRRLPLWVKFASVVTKPFNPLWTIRAAGPLGPLVMQLTLGHLISRLFAVDPEANEREHVNFAPYGYHCNAQEPTGEMAFKTMSDFVWARRPMFKRIPTQLHPDMDVSIIYGQKSFIWRLSQKKFEQLRQNGGGTTGYTHIQILEGTGHVLFLDKKEEFNEIVLQACSMADKKG